MRAAWGRAPRRVPRPKQKARAVHEGTWWIETVTAPTFWREERKRMLLDDNGMWNQYMVRLRIAVRADANIVLELLMKMQQPMKLWSHPINTPSLRE